MKRKGSMNDFIWNTPLHSITAALDLHYSLALHAFCVIFIPHDHFIIWKQPPAKTDTAGSPLPASQPVRGLTSTVNHWTRPSVSQKNMTISSVTNQNLKNWGHLEKNTSNIGTQWHCQSRIQEKTPPASASSSRSAASIYFLFIVSQRSGFTFSRHTKKNKKTCTRQRHPVRYEAASWKADNPNTNEKQIPPESHLKGIRPKVRITHSSRLIPSHRCRRSPRRPLSAAHSYTVRCQWALIRPDEWFLILNQSFNNINMRIFEGNKPHTKPRDYFKWGSDSRPVILRVPCKSV